MGSSDDSIENKTGSTTNQINHVDDDDCNTQNINSNSFSNSFSNSNIDDSDTNHVNVGKEKDISVSSCAGDGDDDKNSPASIVWKTKLIIFWIILLVMLAITKIPFYIAFGKRKLR